MNKQDKIKKVMREFKDGKLKTPNGEVVTDKKQALAIAMSEGEDYAEKADLIEDISISSLSDAEDVIKGIGSEELLEKAVYADTAENRKLGRVGQEYHRGKGTKKEDKKTNKNSWGYEIKPEYSNRMSKLISKKFGKYLDGEDDSMEFIDSYWKSVANGADEKALQNSLKHAIHDRVSPGSKDADNAFKEAMANIKHYEKESQKHYKIKSKTEVKKAVDDEIGISDAHRELFGDDLEKAHQDGDMHPNGKWVWVSSANGGKGDWRTLNGRAHKKHADTQASNKFLENFKNASDDVLNKIVSGKIQVVDRERKLAQQILDSRKKSGTQSQPQSKNIGNLSYNYDKDTDETWYEGNVNNKRVRVLQEEVGDNSWWNVEVDGKKLKNANGKEMTFSSAKEAADEGVIEAKKSTQNKKQSKGDKVINPSSSKKYHMTTGQLNELLGRAETKVENGEKKYLVSYKAIGKDRGSSWQTKSQIESYLRGWDDAQVSLPDKKKKSIKSGSKTNDLSSTKINLSVNDYTKKEADDEDGDYKNAPLKLHDYIAKSVEYYDNDGNKKKASPFISEYYADGRQNKVGGYEAYFNGADSIGTFKTLNEAVAALNDWANKMRVPGHGKPKWIYNQSKGDYQMNYSLDVPVSTAKNVHVQKLIDTYKISNNSYTDTSKMSIVITPKGNWNLRYDGKDVSTISGQRNIMDRKTLEAAGIKFEESKKRPVGAGTNGPTPKTKADKKVK